MSEKADHQPLALIIEDDDKLSVIYTEALHQAMFETLVIHDGAKAMEQLRIMTPAVVVLDLHLPHVSGDKILSQIRQDERFVQTKVIVTTADATQAGALQDLSDLVLIKPISFLQLRDLAKRMRAAIP